MYTSDNIYYIYTNYQGVVTIMSRPPKPFSVIVGEKKSHRTKAELEQRKKAEEELLTGVPLRVRPEVKNNPIALKEFNRLNKLLKKIGKNDAIYEVIINRYCIIFAECYDFENKRESFYQDLEELTDDKNAIVFHENEDGKEVGEVSISSYYKMKHNMQKSIIDLDKQVQAKRKMLMDIEKENLMTIAAALRNIPKQGKDETNPLLEALNSG